jgi:hypothetical protein
MMVVNQRGFQTDKLLDHVSPKGSHDHDSDRYGAESGGAQCTRAVPIEPQPSVRANGNHPLPTVLFLNLDTRGWQRLDLGTDVRPDMVCRQRALSDR